MARDVYYGLNKMYPISRQDRGVFYISSRALPCHIHWGLGGSASCFLFKGTALTSWSHHPCGGTPHSAPCTRPNWEVL